MVTAVKERAPNVEYMKLHIPSLEVMWDTDSILPKGPTLQRSRNTHLTSRQHTFLEALHRVGSDPVVMFEDDVILTQQFCKKAEAAIRQRPKAVIQFFSRRAKDIEVGSHWQIGSVYLMNQCFYLPPRMAKAVANYLPNWFKEQLALGENHFGAIDTMLARCFADYKIKHWVSIPSLVEHSIGVSTHHPSRAKKRQSNTFTAPELFGKPDSLVL